MIIFTPDSTHFPIASEALNLGHHVLVTKPATQTLSDHQKLIDLAEVAVDLLDSGHREHDDERRHAEPPIEDDEPVIGAAEVAHRVVPRGGRPRRRALGDVPEHGDGTSDGRATGTSRFSRTSRLSSCVWWTTS